MRLKRLLLPFFMLLCLSVPAWAQTIFNVAVTSVGTTNVTTTIASSTVTVQQISGTAVSYVVHDACLPGGQTTVGAGAPYTFTGSTCGAGYATSTTAGTLKLSSGVSVNFRVSEFPSTAGSGVSGTGTVNHLARWTGASVVGNSTILEDSSSYTFPLFTTNFGDGTSSIILNFRNTGGLADASLNFGFGSVVLELQNVAASSDNAFGVSSIQSATVGNAFPLIYANNQFLTGITISSIDGFQDQPTFGGDPSAITLYSSFGIGPNTSAAPPLEYRAFDAKEQAGFAAITAATREDFYSNLSSGSGKWAFYGAGSAASHVGGTFDSTGGYKYNAAAPSGHTLRGNGTNYVDGQLACGDLSNAGTGCSGAAPTTNQNIREISAAFDGGGSPLSGTTNRCREVYFAGTIQGITLASDVSGGATVKLLSVAYASYTGPASASDISNGGEVMSSAVKLQDSTLTSWTTSLSAGTMVCIQLSSPSTITWLEVTVKVAAN